MARRSRTTGRIPAERPEGKRIPAPPPPIDYDERHPIISFLHLREHGPYSIEHAARHGDARRAFKDFVGLLRTMSQLLWKQVFHHGGLRPRIISPRVNEKLHDALPSSVPEDCRESICEYRASDAFRIFGFRQEDVLSIVLLDPEHEICK